MAFKKGWWLVFVFLLLPLAYADLEYKPYLHKPAVTDAPQVKLYGSYQTNLFPGAATYTYEIEVPPGTNGLQPSLTISYNSQSMKQRPSVIGAGWTLPQNYVMRDINFTPADSSDDFFVLVLNGASYDLLYDDGFFHTEIETFARIQNLSTTVNDYDQYWLVTLKDGTRLRFGYNAEAETTSNKNHDYALKWSLDQIQDTHANRISYSYAENPYPDDNGSTYLTAISYNNDAKRTIEFDYEKSNRPDRRLAYEAGNAVEETRRLSDISIAFNDTLIRRYHFDYENLNAEASLTSLSGIAYFGSDNSSILHNVSFAYYTQFSGWMTSDIYNTTLDFDGGGGNDQGIRLGDLNNDGRTDLLYSNQQASQKEVHLNTESGWVQVNDWAIPGWFVSSTLLDEAFRIADVNNDGFADLLQGLASTRNAWINDGKSFVDESSTWAVPSGMEFANADHDDQGVRLIDVNADGFPDLVKGLQGSVERASSESW